MAVSHGRFGGFRCSIEQTRPAPETAIETRLIARATQRKGDAGGTIGLESMPGLGTTAFFSLPASPALRAERAA